MEGMSRSLSLLIYKMGVKNPRTVLRIKFKKTWKATSTSNSLVHGRFLKNMFPNSCFST